MVCTFVFGVLVLGVVAWLVLLVFVGDLVLVCDGCGVICVR